MRPFLGTSAPRSIQTDLVVLAVRLDAPFEIQDLLCIVGGSVECDTLHTSDQDCDITVAKRVAVSDLVDYLYKELQLSLLV